MLLDKKTLLWAELHTCSALLSREIESWCGKKPQTPATENKKDFFSHRTCLRILSPIQQLGLFACSSSVLLWQLCSEFWRMQPTLLTAVRASWVHTSSLDATVELLLSRSLERVGKFKERGQKLIYVVYLRCSVLYGTVEPFTTGKSILSPLLTDFNVTGSHTLVLNVFFHYWREFLGNQSVKQPFAWDVRHLLTCLTIWVMTLMMTYSRKCHNVSHSCHRPSHDTGEPVVSCYTCLVIIPKNFYKSATAFARCQYCDWKKHHLC